MHESMAKFIVDNLINDPFLVARCEKYNNVPANFDIKVGSVNFYNDQPLAKEMPNLVSANMNHLKTIPDGDTCFNFTVPLHRPFCNVNNTIVDINIIEFDILEKRWNYNDYLWSKLLELIMEYQNRHI